MTLAGTGALVIADRAFKGTFPKPRILLGLALTFVFLGVAVEIAPDLAAAFGLLVFTGTLIAVGPGVWKKAAKSLGG